MERYLLKLTVNTLMIYSLLFLDTANIIKKPFTPGMLQMNIIIKITTTFEPQLLSYQRHRKALREILLFDIFGSLR
jgi:hypothetical protein